MLKKSMHLLIFINVVFSATTFCILYFAGRKIQEYVLIIYSYAPQLQDLQSLLSENLDVSQMNVLNEAVNVINHSYKMIFITTILSMTVFFFVWSFFQSLEWRMTHDSLKKRLRLDGLFDNYWRYALNFAIVTLPAFIMIFPSFYYLIGQINALFLNLMIRMYGMSEPTQPLSYPAVIGLSLLVLSASYFAVIMYALLNRHGLLESVKRGFKTGLKRLMPLLPLHIAMILMILPIIFLDSLLTNVLGSKASAFLSILVYFAFLAYYQVLMVSLLEKE